MRGLTDAGDAIVLATAETWVGTDQLWPEQEAQIAAIQFCEPGRTLGDGLLQPSVLRPMAPPQNDDFIRAVIRRSARRKAIVGGQRRRNRQGSGDSRKAHWRSGITSLPAGQLRLAKAPASDLTKPHPPDLLCLLATLLSTMRLDHLRLLKQRQFTARPAFGTEQLWQE